MATRAQGFSNPVRLLWPLVFVWETWLQLTPKHFLIALLAGLAFAVADNVSFLSLNLDASSGFWNIVVATFVNDVSAAVALMLALVVADRAEPNRLPQWLPYVVAVLIAALTGREAAVLVRGWLHLQSYDPQPFPWGQAWMKAAYSFLHTCLLTGLATFVYVYRSRALRRLAALRDAQLEHAKLGRGVLQSRLQVMQARVEPRFLFNTLAQVERLYETEPNLAGRMLDNLIVYLRGTLPLLHESTSTLAKEMELIRAYLGIMQIRLKERLAFDIDLPDAIKDARRPPMLLLPLVDHAIVHGLEPLKTGGTISIGTTVEGGKLRLTVADSGAGFVPRLGDEDFQRIRERVTALYGDAASPRLGARETQGTQAMMEIPYERT